MVVFIELSIMVKIHIYAWFIQIQIVAKTAGMHRNEWVENADRWVAGFLEMFEEGCHKMVSLVYVKTLCNSFNVCKLLIFLLSFFNVTTWIYKQGTAIRDRIQERLRGQQSRDGTLRLQNGEDDKDDDDEEYYYDDEEDSDEEYFEEYYDDDELNPQNNGKDEKKE